MGRQGIDEFSDMHRIVAAGQANANLSNGCAVCLARSAPAKRLAAAAAILHGSGLAGPVRGSGRARRHAKIPF